MKLSKNEKTLLGVLAVVAALAVIWLLAVQPAVNAIDTKKETLAELQSEQASMQAAIAGASQTEADRSAAAAEAEQNYEEFYATLNSYTIDDIMRGLLADNGLDVRRLIIGDYEKITDAELLSGESAAQTDESDGYLLRCTVQLEAAGSYQHIMDFLTAMNAKSDCLRVRELQLTFASDRNVYGAEAVLNCSVDIYGIERPSADLM